MPDILDPQPRNEKFINPFVAGDRVIHKGLEWIVMNPQVRIVDGRDLALIAAGPYESIRDVVFADELQFPQVNVD